MADNEQTKTNRQLFDERFKGKHSNEEYADDEALFGQINADYDDYDERIKGFEDREKGIRDLFTSNGKTAAFITEWANGGDPIVMMIQRYGDQLKEALEDPDKLEEIAEANREFAEKMQEEEKYEEEYRKNMDETLSILDNMQTEEGYSEEEIDECMSFLMQVIRDGLLGKFTRETIEMAMKAQKHDADVEEADRAGEIRGRNARIEERLRKTNRGDGIPNLAGRNASNSGREMPDLGAISRYDNVQDIWERGGEKRTKYK